MTKTSSVAGCLKWLEELDARLDATRLDPIGYHNLLYRQMKTLSDELIEIEKDGKLGAVEVLVEIALERRKHTTEAFEKMMGT